MAAALLEFLQALVALEPAIESVIPIFEKQFAGEELNDADLAALDAATQVINARAEAAEDAADQAKP